MCHTRNIMKAKDVRPTTGIRIKPDVLHQARVAAVTAKKTLGQWLEEAIQQKMEREQRGDSPKPIKQQKERGQSNEKS